MFDELLQRRTFHGVKKRWRDELTGDLHTIGVGDGWFQLYQDRKQWSEICSSAINILAQSRGTITCATNIFANFNLELFSVTVVEVSKERFNKTLKLL